VKGALSEDAKPHSVFNFKDYFGGHLGAHVYQFELNKDESELKVRRLDFTKGTAIGEYLMTEAVPGEGFTKIEQQPSIISDTLKDLGIKLQDQRPFEVLI
jgi:hypothetical protein